MPSGWAEYRIEYVSPRLNARVEFWVRAISERDARWVASEPCKRNGGRPRVPAGVEFTCEKESA